MRNKLNFFIPSLANIIFLALFLTLLFTPGINLLLDCDTGYHIRTGEYILETFSIPKYDIFSFSTPSNEWINTAWLSDVVMHLLHRPFGLTGVVIFFAFLISFVYPLLFKIIRQYGVNIIFTTLIVLFVLICSQIHWLARPHIFSWILLLIWYYLLDSFWYSHRNYLYFLPPIMLLWINLHGSFALGFMIIVIYLLGSLIRILRAVDKQLYIKKAKFLGLTTIACLIFSFINPSNYHTLLYPFKLVSERFIMDHVDEFLSPNFHYAMAFEFFLLLMIVIFVISRNRLNFIEIILALVFTHMALYSRRFIPVFSIIIAPILAKHAEAILKESDGRFASFLKKRANKIAATDASVKGYIWIVIAIIVVTVGAKGGLLNYGFDDKKKPVAAVEFMKRESLKGNMFNNDEFGDYIIYSAYPQYRVFIDGRIGAVYDEKRLKEYSRVIFFESGWEGIIEKYNIKWIIFDTNSILSRFLLEKKEWHLIYSDKVANIFVRKIPENEDLIKKYQNVNPVIVEQKN